ncbi:MAG: lysylphosphatidylglycerol synthase transmembrane domain-containing protein [Candidatus Glassbacteria bacterium]
MKYIKHVIALTISLGCLYFAFRGVNFREALSILYSEHIRYLPLSIFIAMCLIVMWVRAWRWKYFYLPEHKATVAGLTVANLIGFMSNNILPLRIGEMVRVVVARRKVNAPVSYTLAALFIERVLDSLCLLICLVFPLSFGAVFPPLLVKIARIMIFVFAGAVIMLIILRSKPELVQKAAVPVGRWFLPAHTFEKFEHFMGTFSQGLAILRNGPAMVKIIALSLFHWWLIVFSYSLAFRGFGIDGLPWTAPYLTMGLVGLGVALPSAPAFVGPVHWAIIFSLNEVFGVARSTATGFAIIMHLLMMVPITIVGLILMWREGLTLGQIRERADHLEEANGNQASA